MHPEVQRRLVHVSGAVVPVGYQLGLSDWRTVQLLFAGCALSAFCIELARLTGRVGLGPFDGLLRGYERSGPAGYSLYFLSTTAVVFGVDPQFAVPALLVLMVGDPVIGLLYPAGSALHKPGHVLAVMFVLSWLLSVGFVTPVAAVCGAVGATLADGKKPTIGGRVIDDNLSIPPLTAGGFFLGELIVTHL